MVGRRSPNVGWDTTFGSTVINVSGELVEVMQVTASNVNISGMLVETMFQSPASSVRVAGIVIEVLRTGALGNNALQTAVTIMA